MNDISDGFVKRVSMLDNIDFHVERNLYCERKLLTNEASIERCFVDRFLDVLFRIKFVTGTLLSYTIKIGTAISAKHVEI